MSQLIRPPSPLEALRVLDSRTKRMPYYGYKLGDGGQQYGMDVVLPDRLDCDENAMSLWLPYADGNRRDGVGDLLEIGGIRLDRHRKNPIALFDHGKSVTLPLGLCSPWDSTSGRYDRSQYTVELDHEAKKASANVFFWQGKGVVTGDRDKNKEHAQFCEQLFDMAVKGLVTGGSIGYQVIHASEIPADYNAGTPKGLHLQSVLQLECSLVVMPANMDTVRKTLSDDRVCGKPLSPYLKKSLMPYAPARKAQLGWEPGRLIRSAKKLPEKETVKLPRGQDHSKTDIPPARWRPGVGAVKSQESKEYREGYRARIASKSLSECPYQGKNESAHKEWQRGWKAADRDLKNKTLARKPMDAKALDALRRRLRAKRQKKSATGSSVVFVKKKDLKNVQQHAARSGLSVKWMRDRSGAKGVQKLKLTGGKDHIQSIASKYGRRMKGGWKALPLPNGRDDEGDDAVLDDPMAGDVDPLGDDVGGMDAPPPDMGDDMGDMPPPDMGADPLDGLDDGMGDMPPPDLGKKPGDVPPPPPDLGAPDEEPYGAQVVRRMHKDHSILLEDYHEIAQMLENPSVKSYVLKKLEMMEGDLSELEEIFRTEYGDKGLAELEGSLGIDIDGDGEVGTVDGKPPEELEDNAEGGEGDHEEPDGDEPEGDEDGDGIPDDIDTDEADTADSEVRPEPPEEDAVAGMKTKPGAKRLHVRGRKNLPGPPPGDEEPPLKEFETAGVKDAHGFLGELTETETDAWGDEHRMKSFHYHKTLGAIGDVLGMAADATGGKGQRRKDYDPMEPLPVKPAGKPRGNNPFRGARKACKEASEFFKELSGEKAFGDRHRDGARHHHKQLGAFAGGEEGEKEMGGDPATDLGDMSSMPPEPGEMGEKSSVTTALRMAQQQAKDLEKLQGSINGLLSKL